MVLGNETSGGGGRWWTNRRPKFCLVPGIQLDRDQTSLNTYELNRRSKKRKREFKEGQKYKQVYIHLGKIKYIRRHPEIH